ncbi:MAG: RNA polymerase sigma factor [Pseudonocardiaceae bacterium]
MTEDQTPGMGPKEVERSNYASLVKSLAGTLDLRGGLSEAIDIVDYTAMSSHITSFLDLEAGLKSALAGSTQADAELPLHASAETTDSAADLVLRIGDEDAAAWDAAAWDEIFGQRGKLVSTTVRSFRLQEANALDSVSSLAVSTRSDTELPLRSSAETTDSATDLLLRIGAGDATSWDEIFSQYGQLVSTTVRSYGLQEADAQDAVQTTWLRLAENAYRIHFPERLGGWLATTARRECLRILRQAKPVQDAIDDLINLPPDTVADPSADPEKRAIDADTARTLRKLVAELSPRLQNLIWMLFTANAPSYAEVAHVTGIPQGGIGPTRARALRQLRAKLNEYTL